MLLIYHDVLDVDKCDLLIHEHETNPNKHIDNPLDQAFDNRVLLLQNMQRSIQEVAAIIALEVGKLVGRHFQIEVYPETVSVVRWGQGEEMALHRDGQNPHTINRTHSVVLYLNDQPEGGEIYFPEMGVIISPRRALMVAYEKTILHGVRPVKHPRYTLTLWYSDQSEVSIIR
jgi:hypothetical protein